MKTEEIKFVFNEPVLQIGDILLMNTYHERQRRAMVGCQFDHAAIYVGDAFIMEADGLGVTQSHIYSYGFKAVEDACVLRLKEAKPKQLEGIVIRAREEMGKAYGVREAYRVLKYKDDAKQDALTNATFCSRFVAVAYNSQGFKIANNPNYCVPDDFLKSDILYPLDAPLLPATLEIISTVMKTQTNRENPDVRLQEAFEKYSELYGTSIQSMTDLMLASIHRPELDDEAVRIMNEELNLFHADEETKQNWPWFDDDAAFEQHFKAVEDRLFFLCSQFLHYDKTYLPLFARNCVTTSTLQHYYPYSKLIARIQIGFKSVYDEAVRIRERLTYLYLETRQNEREAFDGFAEKCGFYHNFIFQEPITDIGFIIKTAMQWGFPILNI